MRSVAATVTALALVASGCSHGGATPARPPRNGVFLISITYPGSHPAGGHGTGWLDPATGAYRVASIGHGESNGRAITVRTLAVGRPGASQVTTRFPGLAPASVLSYGEPGGLAQVPGVDALAVMQAYVRGRRRAGTPAYRVTTAGGRVRLTYGAAHLRIAVTIRKTISQRAARARGLFALDPGSATETVRPLAPGVRPSAPRPVYWLGRSYAGFSARPAISTVVAKGAPSGTGTTYEVRYSGRSFSISTQDLPGYPRKGQPIRLADGRPAWFRFSPAPLGAAAGALSSSLAPTSVIFVTTRSEQISIDLAGAVSLQATRPLALRIARALRRV